MNNVVLCGFMGCGKSTVGRNLARKTGRKFLDMDRYIEEKAGMSVKEIFEKQGEDGFRELEHEACVELSDTPAQRQNPSAFAKRGQGQGNGGAVYEAISALYGGGGRGRVGTIDPDENHDRSHGSHEALILMEN